MLLSTLEFILEQGFLIGIKIDIAGNYSLLDLGLNSLGLLS